MCNIGFAEAPRIWTETIPKARKTHICCECGSEIYSGEKYEKITGLWDDFETYKTCLFCSNVRDDHRRDSDMPSDEGIPFGELWECVGIDYAGESD